MNPIQQMLSRRMQEAERMSKTHHKVLARYQEHQERMAKIRADGYRKICKLWAKLDYPA